MNIVFLAAGKSSRIYKEVGKPKCLLKINNQKSGIKSYSEMVSLLVFDLKKHID